jgi:hypothetical protein
MKEKNNEEWTDHYDSDQEKENPDEKQSDD